MELVLLTAALVLLVASIYFEDQARNGKLFSTAFLLLALLSVGSYFDFGAFRGRGTQVHTHEQFHFFLGSKYLEELRYDAIYDAVILALEDEGRIDNTRILRRYPTTFRTTDLPITPRVEAEIRGRFTPDRWEEFRRDVVFFVKGPPGNKVRDHGNTGSPSWALVARAFTGTSRAGQLSSVVFANLDPFLLLVLFVTIGWAFGLRATSLAMIVGLSVPLVYEFLGVSILRLDWLAALGISVCFFEKRHFRTAGILLGYAVTSKPFVGVMVLPVGLHFLAQAIHERRVDRERLRYVLYASFGAVLFVILSSLYFDGLQIWRDYVARLSVTLQEHYHRRQHSFRDLFLQAYQSPASVWHPIPRIIAAADPAVFISHVRGAFVATQTVLLAGLVFLAARNSTRFAFALGPLAVFVLLVTNRYYWQMWVISAMVLTPTYLENRRDGAFLGMILAWLVAGNAMLLTADATPKGGYFGSYGLFWIGAGLLSCELASWYRQRRVDRHGVDSKRAMSSE